MFEFPASLYSSHRIRCAQLQCALISSDAQHIGQETHIQIHRRNPAYCARKLQLAHESKGASSVCPSSCLTD